MKSMNRCGRRRGAATIEAVLALSVFILVWVGVLHMGRSYNTKLELKSKARACAWIQSANSCDVDLDCRSEVGEGTVESSDADLMRHFGSDGDFGGFLKDLLKRQVEKLFGERATVSASRELQRPIHLGGEQVAISASYSIPCNTKPITADTLAGQLLELVKEKIF